MWPGWKEKIYMIRKSVVLRVMRECKEVEE